MNNNKLLIFAHRANNNYLPENSLLAIKSAINIKINAIEIDVRLTKDKIPLIIHNNNLKNIINKSVRVSRVTHNQIDKLTAPFNIKIPTLEEILLVMNNSIILNLELKNNNMAKIVYSIIKSSDKSWYEDKIIISSSHVKELRTIKKLNPKIKTALVTKFTIFLGMIKSNNNFNIIVVNQNYLKKYFIKLAHKKNLLVYCYTINTSKQLNKMLKLGADGIFTDNYDDLDFLSR